jgi:hypothetical protein
MRDIKEDYSALREFGYDRFYALVLATPRSVSLLVAVAVGFALGAYTM